MSQVFKVYNTLSGRKEPFQSVRPGRVSVFVCGPTVQSLIHLGHARTYVLYDVLARYLSHLGYDVDCLMNITDVDGRITEAAEREGTTPGRLARRYSKTFLEDIAHLGITSFKRFEPVSRHVGVMIRQVSKLLKKGKAYEVDGWVYFDTSTFRSFGALSHLSKRELSLRPLELSLKKRNLTDFALWRPETLVKGKWRSPWGMGSPGWHIQDTAVTLDVLGPRYDIHGGAYELIYPHHEAEIAQAESITGLKPLVRYWVHTHLVNMEGHKMSKTRGNVYTVRDALRRYTADELRVFFLSTHYRKDMDLEGLDNAARRLRGIRRKMNQIADGLEGRTLKTTGGTPPDSFLSAMNDDLDTPKAITSVERLLEAASRERDSKRRASALMSAGSAMALLGVKVAGS